MTHEEEATIPLRLKLLEDAISKMDKTLMEVRDKVIVRKDCPDPGACIALAARVDANATRILALEKSQSKFLGVVAALIIVMNVIGPKLAAIIFAHIGKTP